MTNDPQNKSRDDEVLAKLFKQSAKETSPAKLDHAILNYAASPEKSTATSNSIGSHFGGGWKVPLSMAASVVVVFALLVQLDQNPQQLELPSIPEISAPTEHSEELHEADETFSDDSLSFIKDRKESGLGSQSSDTLILETPATINKTEKLKTESAERAHTQQELTTIPSATANKAKSKQDYAAPKPETLAKPQVMKKQMQVPAKDRLKINVPATASDGVTQERSMQKHRDNNNTSTLAADSESTEDLTAESAEELYSSPIQTEAEFAPIPVEDWLLMIEKLVAQKDYAEAARQLAKFKQAHPKVNVEDLDAQIP